MCCFQENPDPYIIKNLLMGLMYLVADKEPGYYEGQKSPTDMESKAMQAVIIGATIA